MTPEQKRRYQEIRLFVDAYKGHDKDKTLLHLDREWLCDLVAELVKREDELEQAVSELNAFDVPMELQKERAKVNELQLLVDAADEFTFGRYYAKSWCTREMRDQGVDSWIVGAVDEGGTTIFDEGIPRAEAITLAQALDKEDKQERNMEATIKSTHWTCSKGHTRKVGEDLRDPYDNVRVMRATEEMLFGCMHTENGIKCGDKVKRTVEYKDIYE